MNNIYVDKFPKSCTECPFCKDIKVNGGMDRLLFCKAYKFNKWKLMKDIDKCFNKCEIRNNFKPLSNRLAEERKKVLWEIRKRAKRTQIYIKPTEKSPTGKEKCFVYEVSDDFLDQIKRSE